VAGQLSISLDALPFEVVFRFELPLLRFGRAPLGYFAKTIDGSGGVFSLLLDPSPAIPKDFFSNTSRLQCRTGLRDRGEFSQFCCDRACRFPPFDRVPFFRWFRNAHRASSSCHISSSFPLFVVVYFDVGARLPFA